MLVVFLPIFVTDTKITFVYNFVALLKKLQISRVFKHKSFKEMKEIRVVK